MYKNLKWSQFKKDFDVLNIEKVREQFSSIEDANQELYKSNKTNYSALIKLAVHIYGLGSRQHAYLLKNKPPAPPDLIAEFRKLEKNYNKYTEAEQRKETNRKRSRDYYQRSKEANEALEKLGYIPYEDYQPSRAITFLKKVESEPRIEVNSIDNLFGGLLVPENATKPNLKAHLEHARKMLSIGVRPPFENLPPGQIATVYCVDDGYEDDKKLNEYSPDQITELDIR